MRLAAQLQLLPTDAQAATLRATLERCNEAANWISARGFAAGIVRKYALQKLVYRGVRQSFGLAEAVDVATGLAREGGR